MSAWPLRHRQESSVERGGTGVALGAGDAADHHHETARRSHGRARGTTRRTLGGRAAGVLAKPGGHGGRPCDPDRPRRGDVHRHRREGAALGDARAGRPADGRGLHDAGDPGGDREERSGAWWPERRREWRRLMEYVKIPGTSLSPSRIGLGTWAMGGWMWGGTDDERSIRTICAALDRGITLIDTAPAYGQGRSEEIVGRALQRWGRRDRVVLATKVGLEWRSNGEVARNASRGRVMSEITDSLRRLRTEYIDIYQLHRPDPRRRRARARRAPVVREGRPRARRTLGAGPTRRVRGALGSAQSGAAPAARRGGGLVARRGRAAGDRRDPARDRDRSRRPRVHGARGPRGAAAARGDAGDGRRLSDAPGAPLSHARRAVAVRLRARLEGGRIRANIALQTPLQKELLATYRAVVLVRSATRDPVTEHVLRGHTRRTPTSSASSRKQRTPSQGGGHDCFRFRSRRAACRPLAELAPGGVEGHVRHAAPVDADRREDPDGPEPVDQPLVARHPLPDRPRPDDVSPLARRADVSDRLRLHRPPAPDPEWRGRRADDRAAATPGGGFLPRALRDAAGAGFGGEDSPDAERARGRDPARHGPGARVVRCRIRQSLLACAGAIGPDLHGLPRPLHRQVQPGALLLGQLRPGGDPLLRAAGPPASWRRAAPAGRRRPGGLLPRGQQLRDLARRRPGAFPGLLFVRLPHAGRVRRRAGSSERCLLQPRPGRVH